MTRRQDIEKRRPWEQRVARQRASRMSVQRFCGQERVSVNTFYYWAKRLRTPSGPRRLAAAAKSRPGLAPERVRPAPAREEVVQAVVRFRLNAAVEVSVPADCLEVIRCLANCVQHSPAERSAAFQELVVAAR